MEKCWKLNIDRMYAKTEGTGSKDICLSKSGPPVFVYEETFAEK